MYNLPEYKEKDFDKIKAFMAANPFIVLAGVDSNNRPVATHLPVLIKEDDKGGLYFLCHIMRATDHHKAFMQNPNVLAIFNGPHTYVSASWYTDKQQGSTWNYMTVHARGTVSFLDQPALLQILEETTAIFESNPSSPSLFKHLPEEYISKMSRAIIALRVDVTEMDHVFKLSQNRDENSYRNIVSELETGDQQSRTIAEEMKRRVK
jgi:transcriptional regulator